MPTNINYDTLDAILEEKSNFKIIQKVVTNKLSFWKYCLLAKWNQFPKVLVLPQIEIGYEYFNSTLYGGKMIWNQKPNYWFINNGITKYVLSKHWW